METPICVLDAKTFVDHIQVLKHWIYSGQIRLVVPSCTIDQVEQLYQKSVEPKPTTQEAPRSRSSGKPLRKEYPAFDINPRVAREFIGRLRNRKEQDGESEQRVFIQEKENHEAVRFQEPNEQYTPWKDLDVEEEKPEVVEGPPTSWAEALRRKQNLANGISDKSVSKAPAKPKLVARAAGSESSPWKVKKDAPKISANDVPGALRPLMSCALWRLHESIERNDPNQLFLLTDQKEIHSVALKLNMIVRSCDEVGARIGRNNNETDIDTFGDLEREFGVQKKIAISPPRDIEEANVGNSVPDGANGDLKNEHIMNNSVSSEGTANTETSSIVREEGPENQSFEHKGEASTADVDSCESMVKEQDVLADTAATSAEHVFNKPTQSVESIRCLVDSIIQQDYQKHLSESINGLKVDDVNSSSNFANQSTPEKSPKSSPPSTFVPQPQTAEALQSSREDQIIKENSPSNQISTPSTSILEAAQEPEDSDEEVVVFIPQPKRLSAQQKPAQQSSRPSTPKEQSQRTPAGKSPQKLSAKPQSKGKAARHSPNTSVEGHPQLVNTPTVIDPDAFGRDCRVNVNPSPRLPHHLNGHSNHRIRGNGQNAQVGRMPRSSPRQVARTSPPRNLAHDDLRHLTPLPGPAPKEASSHRRQGPRASPRREPVSKVEELTSMDGEHKSATVAALSESQFDLSQTVESADFVPRTSSPGWNAFGSSEVRGPTDSMPGSAVSNAELKPNGPQPRIFEASEFVSRPPRPVRESKPRTPRPKVFEATEFVPRDFVPRTSMPRAQTKRHSPEPESIEPRPSNNHDVDYVLKSGSTRASARGRGRLWTPS